jgi:hypothetical protein
MTRWFSLGCVLCLFCLPLGCGSGSGPAPVAMSGTVELDGKPLDDGSITLSGEAGDVPETFPVKNGKFEGKATPGKKRVEIRAFRQGKATKMGDTIIEGGPENYLPDRFNTESKLTAEVGKDGITPSKFAVQSK